MNWPLFAISMVGSLQGNDSDRACKAFCGVFNIFSDDRCMPCYPFKNSKEVMIAMVLVLYISFVLGIPLCFLLCFSTSSLFDCWYLSSLQKVILTTPTSSHMEREGGGETLS
jgi:hypothetical protein